MLNTIACPERSRTWSICLSNCTFHRAFSKIPVYVKRGRTWRTRLLLMIKKDVRIFFLFPSLWADVTLYFYAVFWLLSSVFCLYSFQQSWLSSSSVLMNFTVPSFKRTQPPLGSWLSKVNSSGPPCWFHPALVSNNNTISPGEFGWQFGFIA